MSAEQHNALLEKIVQQLLADQRRQRRGQWFWRSLIGLYLLALLAAGLASGWEGWRTSHQPHAGVIKISGPIGPNTSANAERIGRGLRRIEKQSNVAAVLIEIESPGGSPGQAERIVRAIERVRARRNLPVVAVIGDTGASAAYYIAAMADTVYAGNASLVGSIGVRLDSFGLTDAMQRIGIERRLFTAGEHKAILDMFSPVTDAGLDHISDTLTEVHEQFIAVVKAGRGRRINRDPELFSGLFWTGAKALELGLVDHIGDRQEALDHLGLARAIDYTPRSLADSLSEGLGALAAAMIAKLGWRWH